MVFGAAGLLAAGAGFAAGTFVTDACFAGAFAFTGVDFVAGALAAGVCFPGWCFGNGCFLRGCHGFPGCRLLGCCFHWRFLDCCFLGSGFCCFFGRRFASRCFLGSSRFFGRHGFSGGFLSRRSCFLRYIFLRQVPPSW